MLSELFGRLSWRSPRPASQPARREYSTRQVQLLPAVTIQTHVEKIQQKPFTTPISTQDYQLGDSGVYLLPIDGFSRSSRGNSVSSRASSSRDSSYSKISTDSDSLNAQLHRARIECHQRPHKFFIPICDQESLITVANIVKDIQAHDLFADTAETERVAEKACRIAPKLYATLACLRKGPDIRTLLKEGVSDKDLPLKRRKLRNRDFALHRDSGGRIEAFREWGYHDIEELDRIQFWMLSPVFKYGAHHDLEEGTILPFIPFETNSETIGKKKGGFSEVYAARIHPFHHNFWPRSQSEEDEPLVAVKRLLDSDKVEFDQERNILKALGSQREKHPHLITLLATFKHKGRYHLVFRYANANLMKYWEDTPLPSFNKQMVWWSLNQMTGIAHALELLHNFSFMQSGVSREIKEALFGRHGDIKPENVLHFPDSKDENGILQLADFGLGRLHRRDSRSQVPWEQIKGGSPTYQPPECKIEGLISRKYDIWSIGCLYLEYITWLLMGSLAITGFSDARRRTDVSLASNDDHFFSIVKGEATVRHGVISWVRKLRGHDKCSALIHELLDLIMERMLLPDSKKRISAEELHQQLHKCLRRANIDEDYLLKPVPRQPKPIGGPVFKPAPRVADAPQPNEKSVTSWDLEKFGSSVAPARLAKDLVGRARGTPGHLQRSNTWLV